MWTVIFSIAVKDLRRDIIWHQIKSKYSWKKPSFVNFSSIVQNDWNVRYNETSFPLSWCYDYDNSMEIIALDRPIITAAISRPSTFRDVGRYWSVRADGESNNGLVRPIENFCKKTTQRCGKTRQVIIIIFDTIISVN